MNTRFEIRLASVPNSIWSKITQIDELKGRWAGSVSLSPYVLNRLKRSVLITSTGASTRIEGSHMTDEDIEKMLRGISIQTFNDRDKQEVQGYYELLHNVFESWMSLSFTEGTIKHFHQELLKYAVKDVHHRGEYKYGENKVEMIDEKGQSHGVLFDTTPAYLTPTEMHELVEWTQKALKEKTHHPLLIVGNFIVEFLNIHPFIDGNGRISRILTNLLLLKEEYVYVPFVSHEKLIEDNKPEYYLALRKSQKTIKTDKPDITAWLEFFLTILLNQSQMAIQLLSEESIEKILSPNQLKVWEYLQTTQETTPKKIVEQTGVARPTVSQVLDKLMELKKVERIGLGSATRYRVVVRNTK
ncbi:Fic family protein [Candidatus Woesebacteria bacterium]|nr:Fic family protein [Candidatus Woesebacteria bacterium]